MLWVGKRLLTIMMGGDVFWSVPEVRVAESRMAHRGCAKSHMSYSMTHRKSLPRLGPVSTTGGARAVNGQTITSSLTMGAT